MLKAVIFDMDGVLVDSEPLHFEINSTMLRENFGIEIDYEYYKKFIGSSVANMWKHMRVDLGLTDYTWQQLSDMETVVKNRIKAVKDSPAVEGAADFVRLLSKERTVDGCRLKLAVASSSSMKSIEKNTKRLGINQCFDSLVSGADLERPKPAPDIFILTAKELGVCPEECLVIEDSKNGVAAAKAAGMACLGYVNKNSGNQDLGRADALFENFSNLTLSFVNEVYCHWKNEPWQVLETDRLIVREMQVSDLDRLYEIYDDPEVSMFTEKLYKDRDMEKQYIEDYRNYMYKFFHFGIWILQLKETGEIIGRAGVEYTEDAINPDNGDIYINECTNDSMHDEVLSPNQKGYYRTGYVIDKAYRNMGYAYEALSAVIPYVREEFEVGSIIAQIHPQNEKSIRLVKKLGFVKKDRNIPW